MTPPVPSGEQRSLLKAAADGNLELFKSISSALDRGKGRIKEVIEAIRDRGAGALHAAAVNGRMPVCVYLVEEVQVDINAADDKGDTPLISALRGFTAETVKYLLDHGADPKIPDENGITALHVAAGEGMCEMIEVLLSKGADVNSFSECGTPLHVAIIGEQDTAVKILLDHHADCNKAVSIHYTPLIAALEVRSLEYVKLLIQAGADVKGVGPLNPLIVAVDRGLTECYRCLIEAGANPDVHDDGGLLPIEIAARNNRREDVEILFPVTSRAPHIHNWSVDGIIDYVNSVPKVEEFLVQSSTADVDLLSKKKRRRDAEDADHSPLAGREEPSRKFKVQKIVTGVVGKRRAHHEDSAEEVCVGPRTLEA